MAYKLLPNAIVFVLSLLSSLTNSASKEFLKLLSFQKKPKSLRLFPNLSQDFHCASSPKSKQVASSSSVVAAMTPMGGAPSQEAPSLVRIAFAIVENEETLSLNFILKFKMFFEVEQSMRGS